MKYDHNSNRIDEFNWEFEPTVLPHFGAHCGYFQRELVNDCNQRYNFFKNRIVWNYLPDEIVADSHLQLINKLLPWLTRRILVVCEKTYSIILHLRLF